MKNNKITIHLKPPRNTIVRALIERPQSGAGRHTCAKSKRKTNALLRDLAEQL